MASAPIHRLKKEEIAWMASHTCKAHRHSFLSHYQCYIAEQPDKKRVGYLDIETSHLDADIGIVLSWCIKPDGKGPIQSDVITRADIDKAKLTGREDARVVRSLVEAIADYDVVITWYGRRFDVPFIRTRAVMLGIPFPSFGTLKHVDAYDMCKFRFKLMSNRLKHACRALLGKTDKTEIEWPIWRAAARGDKGALEYVLDHNEKDVMDLEKIYHVLIPYSKGNQPSL